MSTSLIDTDVLAVLARAECNGNLVRLPGGQLDRKLYVAVNDALERIGGKWNKKARAHVFPSDASAAIDAMVSSGVKPAKNPDAFFATPRAVVERMIALADLGHLAEGAVVLEPSAGTGAIANAVRREFPRVTVHCIESNEDRALACSNAGNLHVWCADFLDFEGATDIDPDTERGYDAVLMNPPFAVDSNATVWVDHVRHAHAMLHATGALVAVVPNGYLYRDDRKHTAFREWAEQHGAQAEPLPPDAFKETGTRVATVLLRLRA